MSRLFRNVALIIAFWECLPTVGHANTFTIEGLQNGHVMERSDCRWRNTAVWVIVAGKGECVRYFHAGITDNTELVHVWFHGDRTRQKKSKYERMTTKRLRKKVRQIYRRYHVPYIQLSRPGVYGSSGYHGDRRRPRESNVINAALNKIKSRHGIKRFLLSGQSGGGHVIASLLTMRGDIACAVITSGAVAVRQRIVLRGWSTDRTGHNDYFDPIDHIDKIHWDVARRIFIIGDPGDTNVPFATQVSYFRLLKRYGHKAWLIRGKGRGRKKHALAWLGLKVMKWCVDRHPANSIVKRAEGAR